MTEIIKECDNCKYAILDAESFPCNRCKRNAVDKWEPITKPTNADCIRAMNDEELAEYLSALIRNGHEYLTGEGDWRMWLQSEAE